MSLKNANHKPPVSSTVGNLNLFVSVNLTCIVQLGTYLLLLLFIVGKILSRSSSLPHEHPLTSLPFASSEKNFSLLSRVP